MNPLEMTADDFTKVQDKNVAIRYLDRNIKSHIEITGIIRQVYLARNPPNLPGSFDFQISADSKQVLKNSKLEIPDNIAVLDVSKIELI